MNCLANSVVAVKMKILLTCAEGYNHICVLEIIFQIAQNLAKIQSLHIGTFYIISSV